MKNVTKVIAFYFALGLCCFLWLKFTFIMCCVFVFGMIIILYNINLANKENGKD